MVDDRAAAGVFDFSYYDHFMLLAAERGLHILPVLYDTPAWAGPNYNAIPSNPQAFAQFVAAVIGRYGVGGSFWVQHPTLAGSAIWTWESGTSRTTPVAITATMTPARTPGWSRRRRSPDGRSTRTPSS